MKNTSVYWDIPEYSGEEDELELRMYRPDGKIIMKKEKRIIVVEKSVPWIENRDIKYNEKVEKYDGILRKLKREYREIPNRTSYFYCRCIGRILH